MCFDTISYLLGKKQGGGGEAPTLINKNITANGTYNASDDEADGYKKVVVDVPATTYPDWTAIGYQGTPQAIIDGYNYAKQIYDNWDESQTDLSNLFKNDKNLVIMPMVDTSNVTNMSYTFASCTRLIEVPLLNTSNVTTMSNLFYGCYALENFPIFDTSSGEYMEYMFASCYSIVSCPLIDTSSAKDMSFMFQNCSSLQNVPILSTSSVTNMNSMFTSCTKLTDESLDNILQMCINATSYSGTKTLSTLGFRSTSYKVAKIQALPHYQDFINAGWTIGY